MVAEFVRRNCEPGLDTFGSLSKISGGQAFENILQLLPMVKLLY